MAAQAGTGGPTPGLPMPPWQPPPMPTLYRMERSMR